MNTFTFIWFLVLIPLIHWDLIQGQTVTCPNGKTRGLICYTLYKTNQTWSTAEAYCQGNGDHLAAIRDTATQDILVTYMDQEGVTDVWVGGEEYEDDWSWVRDDSQISAQGCYLDQISPRDLSHKSNLQPNVVTPEMCIDYCRNNTYMYAGVQLSDRAEQECYCDDSYGTHGKATGCTMLCSKRDPLTNDAIYCGDHGSNLIYKIGGGYGIWAYNQPNNWADYQFCAAIDTESTLYKFSDETCSIAFYYICDIGSGSGPCTATGYHILNGQCVYISETTKSWFASHSDCRSRGGELVTIDSKEKHDLIKNKIIVKDSKHWMGLVSHRWRWSDGSSMNYFNFASNKPASHTSKCLHISKDLSYMWSDDHCSNTKAYICEKDFTTTTAEPTTVPSTTAATTQAADTTSPAVTGSSSTGKPGTTKGSNTTTNGTQSTGEPGVGASTEGSSLTNFQIALIALLIVLIIVIVICTVIFIIYKKKNSTGRVEPEKSYDARAGATVANGGIRHDPYLDNGDPAGIAADPHLFNEKPLNSSRLANGETPRANGYTPRDRIMVNED